MYLTHGARDAIIIGKLLRRILRLVEMPDDKVPENLIVLSLHQVCSKSVSVDSQKKLSPAQLI